MKKVDISINDIENTARLGMYEESGWYARVLILADDSDADFERYTLQVLRNLTIVDCAAGLTVGATFQYMRRRGYMCWGMPQLTLDQAAAPIGKNGVQPARLSRSAA
jgi:hypothetical protein